MHTFLASLTSADLRKMLRLRLRIERHEAELLAIHKRAQARPKPTPPATPVPLHQPSLRELISGILHKAKEPMSVPAIYEATLLAGYRWRSREPINALNVKLYTDPTFKKAAPGRFVLRKP